MKVFPRITVKTLWLGSLSNYFWEATQALTEIPPLSVQIHPQINASARHELSLENPHGVSVYNYMRICTCTFLQRLVLHFGTVSTNVFDTNHQYIGLQIPRSEQESQRDGTQQLTPGCFGTKCSLPNVPMQHC